jgi:hypothetical protein
MLVRQSRNTMFTHRGAVSKFALLTLAPALMHAREGYSGNRR